jgi:hypothetical protein
MKSAERKKGGREERESGVRGGREKFSPSAAPDESPAKTSRGSRARTVAPHARQAAHRFAPHSARHSAHRVARAAALP